MESLRLVLPEERYLVGYLQFCKEIKQTGSTSFYIPDPDKFDDWKHTIIGQNADFRQGINLPENYVPCHSFWLIEGDELIGCCNVRHRLTPALLQSGGHIGYAIRPSKWRQGYGSKQLALALMEARKLGLERVLITCDDTNTASACIIEKNGGTLEDKRIIDEPTGSILRRRYWITLRP